MNILLQAVDRLGKDVEYYAVDLSLPELERTFGEIPTGKTVLHYNVYEVEEETGIRGRVASAYEVGPVKVFVAWLDVPISTSTRSGLVLFTYRCTHSAT